MTPLPKRKHSTARAGKRRQALRLALTKTGRCPKCSAPKASHQACKSCGYYR